MARVSLAVGVAVFGTMAAGFLSSCVETQDVPESAVALEIRPVSGAATKAAIDGTVFPVDRSMVVSAYFNAPAGLGSSADYFWNTTFAKDGDIWKSTADPKFWPMNGTLDIFAYSADGLSLTGQTYYTKKADGVTVTVPDNATVQTDILACGVRAQTKNTEGVPMAFRHAQALVCFTAESNVAYNAASNYGITITGITLKDAYYGGTLDMAATNEILVAKTAGGAVEATASDGYFLWTNLGSQADKALSTNSVADVKLPYNVPETAMNISAEGKHFGIGGLGILVPEQAQTSLVINFTLHNGFTDGGDEINNEQVYEYTCTGNWEEGKKYVYAIRFGLDEITIAPTVVDWNTQAGGNVVIPEPVNTLYFTGTFISTSTNDRPPMYRVAMTWNTPTGLSPQVSTSDDFDNSSSSKVKFRFSESGEYHTLPYNSRVTGADPYTIYEDSHYESSPGQFGRAIFEVHDNGEVWAGASAPAAVPAG